MRNIDHYRHGLGSEPEVAAPDGKTPPPPADTPGSSEGGSGGGTSAPLPGGPDAPEPVLAADAGQKGSEKKGSKRTVEPGATVAT